MNIQCTTFEFSTFRTANNDLGCNFIWLQAPSKSMPSLSDDHFQDILMGLRRKSSQRRYFLWDRAIDYKQNDAGGKRDVPDVTDEWMSSRMAVL